MRLQGLVSRRGGSPVAADEMERTQARSAVLGAAADSGTAGGAGGGTEGDIDNLRAMLAESEAVLRAARTGGDTTPGADAREPELLALKAAAEDQATEIARLKAALASYQTGEGEDGKDSRMALKAQASALKVQTEEQASTIQRLRAEIAGANERLARQAQHFQDELRRMGAGTMPVAPAADAKRATSEPAARRSLSARIAEPRPARAEASAATEAASSEASRGAEAAKAGGFLKAVESVARPANGTDVVAAPGAIPGSHPGAIPGSVIAGAVLPASASVAPMSPVKAPSAASASSSPPSSVPQAVQPNAGVAGVGAGSAAVAGPLAANAPVNTVNVAAASTAASMGPAANKSGGNEMPMAALAASAQQGGKAPEPRRPRLMDRIAGVDKS